LKHFTEEGVWFAKVAKRDIFLLVRVEGLIVPLRWAQPPFYRCVLTTREWVEPLLGMEIIAGEVLGVSLASYHPCLAGYILFPLALGVFLLTTAWKWRTSGGCVLFSVAVGQPPLDSCLLCIERIVTELWLLDHSLRWLNSNGMNRPHLANACGQFGMLSHGCGCVDDSKFPTAVIPFIVRGISTSFWTIHSSTLLFNKIQSSLAICVH